MKNYNHNLEIGSGFACLWDSKSTQPDCRLGQLKSSELGDYAQVLSVQHHALTFEWTP